MKPYADTSFFTVLIFSFEVKANKLAAIERLEVGALS
jgi:hypothetical protein